MKQPLLVLRPEPGASATVARASAVGLDAIAAPLFTVRPLIWQLPNTEPDAVLMTSAQAALHGGDGLSTLHHLPLYAVGAATASAARAAGFERIVIGDTDAGAILARALADGRRRLLHLAGREHRAIEPLAGSIDRRLVYAAEAATHLPDKARAALPAAITLLHSPRAAALFAGFVDPALIRIAAISERTLAAAGLGWRLSVVAAEPDDASLLAAATKLCDQDA